MNRRDRFYRRVGIFFTVIGSILLIAGIAYELGFPILNSDSLIVGLGVSAVGVALLSGKRGARHKSNS